MKSAAATQASKPAAAKRTRRAAKPAPLVRPELLARARAAGVNLTEVIEQAISAAITKAETEADRARRLAETEISIDQCNSLINQYGLISDRHRLF